MLIEDTIAAIGTPAGEGGIGIVRLSGADAVRIAKQLFRPKSRALQELPSSRVIYGHVIDPRGGDVVDEVLVTVMRKPRSFTREDVVEISCHGGIVPVRRILELVLREGARLAEPGEFTRRAFLNGRIDLAQAEATLDVIRAKTDAALRVAVSQLQGRLSTEVSRLRGKLVRLLAHLEALIDFPEDEVEPLAGGSLQQELEAVAGEIEELMASSSVGRVLREGLRTGIIGKPNVGKSSLLNALLREERAIVTELPGTTRDVIEEVISIRGIPVIISDTAGIRKTSDMVEQIGVERARAVAGRADFLIIVLDDQRGVDEEDEEILKLGTGKQGVVVINKSEGSVHLVNEVEVRAATGWPVVRTSLMEGWGVDELEGEIERAVLGGRVVAGRDVVVSNVRHRVALERAAAYVRGALEAVRAGLPEDLVSIDVRGAVEELGEITGESVTDDVLDKIFSEFCIGK